MSKSQSSLNKQLISLTPDAIVNLYEIDFSILQENFEQLKDLYGINIGADAIYRFCPMINGTNPVIWQGNSYQPLPIKMEGFEHKSDGRLPRPTLTIANPEGIFSKIVHSNEDFANCKVSRKRTYARFLDDENFLNSNNPFGQADPNSHLDDDVYYINKKNTEDKYVIEFELVSALELEESWVPARVVLSSYCNWTYRCEIGCGYKGLPIETSNGKSLTSGFAQKPSSTNNQSGINVGSSESKINAGNYPFGLDDIPEWDRSISYKMNDVVKITPRSSSNPYKRTPQVFVCTQTHSIASDHHPFLDREYWLKDECQKTLSSCMKRFDQTNVKLLPFNKANLTYKGLRFGGFPGTERFPIE